MSTVDGRFDALEKKIESNDIEQKRATRRLELLNLIHFEPHNRTEIEKVARNYFDELGGDWYASNIYSTWAEQYGGNVKIVNGGQSS